MSLYHQTGYILIQLLDIGIDIPHYIDHDQIDALEIFRYLIDNIQTDLYWFHKMGKVKHSIDCTDIALTQQQQQQTQLPPDNPPPHLELNLDPEISSNRRLQRGGNNGKAEILNLEENRVTIQVPGVQSNPSVAVQRNHPATVVKQSSIDRGTNI